MLHCATLRNLSRNLSKGCELFSNSELLLAAQLKYSETSCKRDVTYTMRWLKNALQQSLREVEPDSTWYNALAAKMSRDFMRLQGMSHLAISLATCVATN